MPSPRPAPRPAAPRPGRPIRSRLLAGVLVLTGVLAGPAAPGQDGPPASGPIRHGRWELTFTADGPPPAGVRAEDVRVELAVTAPTGATRTWPGFWDGGPTWRARLRPADIGVHRYAVTTDPALAGVHGQTGTFEVAAGPAPADGPATPPTDVRLSPGPLTRTFPVVADRFTRHGPLVAAPTGTYLAHADGTPLFLLADTAWNGPLKSTPADWEEYLATRAGQGYTAIQFVVPAPWRAAATDVEGRRAFADVDPVATPTGPSSIAIDPAFYRRMDEKFAAVERHGLLSVPVLIWGLKKEDPGQRLSEADAIRLCRYEVARYGAFPVLWMLAGDNPHTGEQAERFRRIGRAVFGDSPGQPVTSHVTGENWPWAGFAGEKWLTVLTYQSGHGDSEKSRRWLATGPVASAWKDFPTRPIFNSEPNYEDHRGYKSRAPLTALDVRRAAWWSLLSASPTAGVTYGGHGIWSWETVTGALPEDHEGTGPAKAWREAVHLPGGEQMAVVRAVTEGLPWWTLRPAPDRLAAQPGDANVDAFVARAESTEGRFAVLYSPAGGDVTVNLAGRKLAPATDGRSSHRAIDPATGEVTTIGPAEATPDAATFRLPTGRDGLLVVRFDRPGP